jgi:integrase/recombinase XerC
MAIILAKAQSGWIFCVDGCWGATEPDSEPGIKLRCSPIPRFEPIMETIPLSHVRGEALAAYLRQARPASPHRELFLRWNPPFRPLRCSTTVTIVVRNVLRRAHVKVHRPGAHVLRHNLATEMVRQGAAFKEIADILGHRSLVSTSVYAKLDLGSLLKVAMPWPGGAQ